MNDNDGENFSDLAGMKKGDPGKKLSIPVLILRRGNDITARCHRRIRKAGAQKF
jgi:hypothetical protein